MTPYVVTRWYRAPEVMLTDGQYDSAQDVWAAACTFAEFVTRKPLFPGKCSMDQVSCAALPLPLRENTLCCVWLKLH